MPCNIDCRNNCPESSIYNTKININHRVKVPIDWEKTYPLNPNHFFHHVLSNIQSKPLANQGCINFNAQSSEGNPSLIDTTRFLATKSIYYNDDNRMMLSLSVIRENKQPYDLNIELITELRSLRGYHVKQLDASIIKLLLFMLFHNFSQIVMPTTTITTNTTTDSDMVLPEFLRIGIQDGLYEFLRIMSVQNSLMNYNCINKNVIKLIKKDDDLFYYSNRKQRNDYNEKAPMEFMKEFYRALNQEARFVYYAKNHTNAPQPLNDIQISTLKFLCVSIVLLLRFYELPRNRRSSNFIQLLKHLHYDIFQSNNEKEINRIEECIKKIFGKNYMDSKNEINNFLSSLITFCSVQIKSHIID
jgi:hypothetical protein